MTTSWPSAYSSTQAYTGYTAVIFDPTVKKNLYYNSTASNNVTKSYGNSLTIDGVEKVKQSDASPTYFDVALTNADISSAYEIGLDVARKTSIKVADATVVTTYQGVETTTVIGSTAQEVFSDNGIFTIDGIKFWINKGYGIDAGQTIAFRAKINSGSAGAGFTLYEVNAY